MSHVAIDVEQQFRAWRQTQKSTSTPEIFMKWEHFQAAEHIIYPLLVATAILSTLIMLLPYVGRKPCGIGYRYAENIPKTKTTFFSTRCSPVVFSLFLVIWMLICTMNAVFALMREMSVNPSLVMKNMDLLNDFLRPTVLLFIFQLGGIASLVLHVLFTTKMYHVGSVAAFAPFAVNFYQTAVLTGNEVSHISVWLINTGLIFSLSVFLAFLIPCLKHEYRLALREMGAHTARIMGKGKRVKKAKDPRKES